MNGFGNKNVYIIYFFTNIQLVSILDVSLLRITIIAGFKLSPDTILDGIILL